MSYVQSLLNRHPELLVPSLVAMSIHTQNLTPLFHRLGEVIEDGFRLGPVDARIRDADAVLESFRALGGHLLVAWR